MKKLVLSAVFVSLFSFPLIADDSNPSETPTFVSLTRRPTPVDQLPSNITVITREQIEQSNAKTLDQVVNQVVSVHTNRTGTDGSFVSMRMRGVPNSAQMRVLIDDQPYGGVSADQIVDLSQIPTANIERIEIVRGGSSVLYGANTTGGIIHVITKARPSGSRDFGFGYQTGSLETRNSYVQAGAVQGKTDVYMTGSHLTTGGFQRNSDADNHYGSVNLGQSFSGGGRISLSVANADNSVGVPQGTAIPISEWDGSKERVASNPTNRSDQRRLEGRLNLEQSLGSSGFVRSTFFGSNSNYRNHYGAGAFDTPYEKNVHVLGNDTRLALGGGSTLGASYERDEFKDTYNSLLSVTDVGAYAEQELKLDRLTLIPALRYDHHSNFGSEYNPRLTAVYQLNSVWAMSGNVSRSFRAPSFFELYNDYAPTNFHANRNLKPEIAWTYDYGNELRIGENQTYKLTGYFTKIHDRIARIDPGNDGTLNDTNANVSKAELSGVEFEIAHSFGPFFGHGNYTYQRARENSVNTSSYVDIALTPAHMANYTMGLRSKAGFTITQTWQYIGRQYELDDRKGRVLASYGLWHARASQQFKKVNVFVGVNNILDKRYAEAFDFDTVNFVDTIDPLPGRTYYGGVDLHFGVGDK